MTPLNRVAIMIIALSRIAARGLAQSQAPGQGSGQTPVPGPAQGQAVASSGEPFPEIVPFAASLELAGLSEPLPFDLIIKAALQFSAGAEISPTAEAALRAHLSGFQEMMAGITNKAELGEKALAYLHSRILKQYSVYQTRVDTAVEEGTFNCVSSAVLYLIFSRSVGLQVGGVRTTDHAFCTVRVNGSTIDVETTNPYGFNAGTKKEFTDSFGKVTGFAYVPPSNYRDRQAIGEKELLSLILLNRLAFGADKGDYRDAVTPAVSAYALVGNEETRQAAMAALTNYATWLSMRREHARAVAFINAAISRFGPEPELSKNQRELTHNLVVSLIDTSRIDEAQRLLEDPTAQAALGELEWQGLSVYVVQVHADRTARAEGFVSASEVIREGMEELGFLGQLLHAYDAYVHNAFAQQFNARKYKEAKALIEKGLVVHPDSGVLAQDLALVEKALQ